MAGKFIRELRFKREYFVYPSIMIEFNIAPNTQIGKIIIQHMVWNDENKYNLVHFDRGGKFLDDFQSQNWIEICHRWFNLADYGTLYDDVLDYFNTHFSNMHPQLIDHDGLMSGIWFGNINAKEKYECAVWFEEEGKLYEPIRFYHDRTNLKQAINQYYKDKNLL